MVKRFFILNVFVLFAASLFAQEISNNDFNKLVNNKSIAYFKANKKYFGCGMNLDCMGLQVVFRTIYFDKANKRLRMSGFVNPMTQNNGDTTGTNIFKIFIAKPLNGELKNIRILAEVENDIKRKSETTAVNLKELSFTTDFKFSKGDCLYIEGGELFRLKEYCISALLKPSK